MLSGSQQEGNFQIPMNLSVRRLESAHITVQLSSFLSVGQFTNGRFAMNTAHTHVQTRMSPQLLYSAGYFLHPQRPPANRPHNSTLCSAETLPHPRQRLPSQSYHTAFERLVHRGFPFLTTPKHKIPILGPPDSLHASPATYLYPAGPGWRNSGASRLGPDREP